MSTLGGPLCTVHSQPDWFGRDLKAGMARLVLIPCVLRLGMAPSAEAAIAELTKTAQSSLSAKTAASEACPSLTHSHTVRNALCVTCRHALHTREREREREPLSHFGSSREWFKARAPVRKRGPQPGALREGRVTLLERSTSSAASQLQTSSPRGFGKTRSSSTEHQGIGADRRVRDSSYRYLNALGEPTRKLPRGRLSPHLCCWTRDPLNRKIVTWASPPRIITTWTDGGPPLRGETHHPLRWGQGRRHDTGYPGLRDQLSQVNHRGEEQGKKEGNHTRDSPRKL